MISSAAWTNLTAEMRAVEEGHRCRLSPDGSRLLVKSESNPEVTYTLTVEGYGGFVAVTCDCPAGRGERAPRGLGVAQCKHAALACRRLEREGLARFSGERWVLTAKAAPVAVLVPSDPFEGLPR